MVKWLHGYIAKFPNFPISKFLYCLLFGFVVLASSFLLLASSSSADELDEINKKIQELKRAREMSVEATTPLVAQLENIEEILTEVVAKLNAVSIGIQRKKSELIDLEGKIAESEELLTFQKEVLKQRVRALYIRNTSGTPFLIFLSKGSAADITREFAIRKAASLEDKKVITTVSAQLKTLTDNKEKAQELKLSLEAEQIKLASSQKEYDEQAVFFRKEIAGARAYQSNLEKQVAELTARQQALLAEKLAGLNLPTTLGAGPLVCVDDRTIEPGFRPAFAFFTFGIPHRVGMNQYGAYGRAQTGQPYQDILRAYFEGISFEKRPNINIKVQGYGEMPLEQYLLGIYEMPESWPLEALKAQAVAARSYALAYTNNGANEICTTQKCQVYKGGNKGGNWEAAVRATEGEVMIHSGQAITAWYASTAGGYTFTSGDVGWNNKPWTKRMRDTSGDVNDFANLFSAAYDRDSPCFYAAQGWRKEYGKSAWVKSEEVADIVNVLLLTKADSSTREHLYQTDKPHPYGGEIWNEERVKQELRSRGITPYDNVSDVSVGWDKGLGRTTGVNVSGSAGSNSFDGSEFKNFFNLRAPANIQIVGPLFNVEKK